MSAWTHARTHARTLADKPKKVWNFLWESCPLLEHHQHQHLLLFKFLPEAERLLAPAAEIKLTESPPPPAAGKWSVLQPGAFCGPAGIGSDDYLCRSHFFELVNKHCFILSTDWQVDHLCLLFDTASVSSYVSLFFYHPHIFSHAFFCFRRTTVCGWGRVTWCHLSSRLSTPHLAWRGRRGWVPARWPSLCSSLWWAPLWANWSCRWQLTSVGSSMLSEGQK